jgi:hypothetical protein
MGFGKDSYSEYLEKGLWKCSESPTNAHFWIHFASKDGYGEFRCKWCLETKWFPTAIYSCMEELGIDGYGYPDLV